MKELTTDSFRPLLDRIDAIIREGYGRITDGERKDLPGDFVTQIDHTIDTLVLEELPKIIDVPVFTEETPIDVSNEDRFWLVDPLDGTRNFMMAIPCTGTSIALIENGEPTIGVITLPIVNERYIAFKGQGIWNDGGVVLPLKDPEDLSGLLMNCIIAYESVSSRHKIPSMLLENGAWIQNFGGVVPALAWFATGRLDAVLVTGLYPWDYAAGVVLAREAGAVVTALSGEQWKYTDGPHDILLAGEKTHSRLLELLSKEAAEQKSS